VLNEVVNNFFLILSKDVGHKWQLPWKYASLCVFSRRFQRDHRRPCPTSAAGVIADIVKSCFGGLRGLWSGCVGYLWMHLFMAVPMTPSAAMSDIGGRRCRRFLTAAALSARTYTLTYIFGGKGCDKKLPSAHGGSPLELQWRHQNRLFSANVALFSMLNRPDCR
jgi:hypothetical protein